ncbi:hypothetical protein [Mycolicibacterium palauense]|uniref:hypothetical protein n=1 Tax=Mycolicibacterium palauense TaxID=2034511 RepID=UPI00114583E8|nr:hypothetical protein [Mycolicibacterium palauense]
MPTAVRPYVTAGVALVGASVISVTPIAPQPQDLQESSAAVRLTAAAVDCGTDGTSYPCAADSASSGAVAVAPLAAAGPSIFNIPVNILNAVLSIPANEVEAMDRFADAMILTGSWQVWSPTNVFGFDAADPPKLKGFIDMLVPFPAFSTVLGNHLSVWAQANLPMNAGCAALPGACPDLGALLDSMFKVPMSELYDGYTFPEVVNPHTGEEMEWSEEHVQLDPAEPITSVWDYLVAPPSGVKTVSLQETFSTLAKLTKSIFDGFYPFVQNSEWYNDDQTSLAPLFRALAPVLCPTCDPDNPYDNPYLYDNYDPHYPSDAEAAESSSEDAAAPAGQAGLAALVAKLGVGGTEDQAEADPARAVAESLVQAEEVSSAADEAAADESGAPVAEDTAGKAVSPESGGEESGDEAEAQTAADAETPGAAGSAAGSALEADGGQADESADSDGTDSDGTDSDGTDSDGTDSDGTDSDGTDADKTGSDKSDDDKAGKADSDKSDKSDKSDNDKADKSDNDKGGKAGSKDSDTDAGAAGGRSSVSSTAGRHRLSGPGSTTVKSIRDRLGASGAKHGGSKRSTAGSGASGGGSAGE